MKKIFLIILLAIFKTNLAFGESCTNQFDWDWVWTDMFGKKVSKSIASDIKFTFRSTGPKGIRITQLRMSTGSGQVVKKSAVEIYLPPYGKKTGYLSGMKSYNLDVIKSAGYSCYFGDEYPKKKTQPLFKTTQKKSGTQKFLDKILGN